MGFKLGIIGLPNVGKSTLFNALSNTKAEVSNYPFTTIDPNIAIVEVPDERTANIAKIMNSPKAVGTAVEFIDIAGLVKGASRGEGLGNKFLSHIREVDAIVHVVRAFGQENVVHVEGSVDPARDIGIINAELLLADLSTIEKKIEAAKSASKTGDKKILNQLSLLERLRTEVGKGIPARTVDFKAEDGEFVSSLCLLTRKPQIFVANIGEEDISGGKNKYPDEIRKIAESEGSKALFVCSKLEADIKELPKNEARQYLAESGIELSGLSKLIKAGYELLELITFFTSNEKETRAWTLKKGAKAPAAAGKVHSDMEKGFIRAEVINYDDLIAAGSYHTAKEKGILRLEGKEYIIKNGDLVHIKFNV